MTYNFYTYNMGIKVGEVSLPDPSKWDYEVADLDTMGKRDGTGLLHRAKVATKVNYSFEWSGLEWEMLQTIISAVSSDAFTLKAPDPCTYNTVRTGTYYTGDRTGSNIYYDTSRPEKGFYSLKVKLIEY